MIENEIKVQGRTLSHPYFNSLREESSLILSDPESRICLVSEWIRIVVT